MTHIYNMEGDGRTSHSQHCDKAVSEFGHGLSIHTKPNLHLEQTRASHPCEQPRSPRPPFPVS
ncbi:mCG147900 [Mus musculus]|nr:mCG147900 [Mus musculus]